MRMGELLRHAPAREIEVLGGFVGRNQFDRGRLQQGATMLGEEHSALGRASQIFLQMKFAVDDVAFPLAPGLAHFALLPSPNALAPALPSRLLAAEYHPARQGDCWSLGQCHGVVLKDNAPASRRWTAPG